MSTPLFDDADLDDGEDAIGSGNIMYTKGMREVPLEARIERLYYINLYGQVYPRDELQLIYRKSSRPRTTTSSMLSINEMYSSTLADRCGLVLSHVSRSGCSRRALPSRNRSRPRSSCVSLLGCRLGTLQVS